MAISQNRIAFYLLGLLLSMQLGCSIDASLIRIDPASLGANAITGILKLDASAPTASAMCSERSAFLRSLSPEGVASSSALASSSVDSQGQYEFTDLHKLAVTLDDKNPRYLVEVSGCGDSYLRPVTGYQDQDITHGSTLVAMTGSVEVGGQRSLGKLLKADVEMAIRRFDSVQSSSLLGVLNGVLTDTGKRAELQSLLKVDPIKLKELPPTEVAIVASESVAEATTASFASQMKHWNTDYTPAYEWLFDGTIMASENAKSKDATLALGKNLQGSHTVTLRIGIDDGAGGIDSGKPVLTKSMTVTVTNDYPPVAPTMSLVGPLARSTMNVSVELATGALRTHCETFSSLALTEDAIVPPLEMFRQHPL